MQYRPLGRNGPSVSIIGLGLEHLDNKPYEDVEETVDAALEHGVNFFDLFMPGTPIREHVGKALKGRRKDVLIQGHIGSVDLNRQYDITRDVSVCKRYFEELLRCLDTDYVDIGMMFFIDSEETLREVFETEYIDYVRRLKREGTIRMIGASSHHPEVAAKLVESGEIEHLMFSVNLAYDMLPSSVYILDSLMSEEKIDGDALRGIDPVRAHLYELCESKGVSIATMKTLGAGKLLSAEQTPFARPLTPVQCIHYALTRPAVVSAMVGCTDRAQVLEAVRYLDSGEEEKSFSEIADTFQGDFRGRCMYCNHCLPCPSNIDVAAVTKYLDIAKLDENRIPPGVRAHYRALAHHASECVECGSCEDRCPFDVAVIENMRRAASIFEGGNPEI